jgi:hypothetical protein
MHKLLIFFALLFGTGVIYAVEKETTVLYQMDFETAEVGKIPSELLVIDGQFAVKSEGTNKVLELPGAPLETFRTLFGPTETSNVVASARILGTAKGRRSPTFGVGLNGVGGVRLQVAPGKKLLELYNGDEVVKTVAFEWKSGEWTLLQLQVRGAANGFVVEGKAWQKGMAEPKEWMVSADVATLVPGRASIWGSPYSGTPIQFDDLNVARINAN